MIYIVLPLYNDWRSLNKLLFEINQNYTQKINILIVDDCSTKKNTFNFKKFNNFKSITIIKNKKNLGSQKSIAIGLTFLKKLKKNFYIIVMDSDGEDNPLSIKEMLNLAKKNTNYVIVSNRKKRRENLFFKTLYKLHLSILFIFTGVWLSYGNFSCFHKKNLIKILKKNYIWLAFSAALQKNTNIIKFKDSKNKRYFDKSKLSYYNLIEHSLKIFSVFSTRIFFTSTIYLIFFYKLSSSIFFNFFLIILICFNIITFKFKINHKVNFLDFLNYVSKINKIK